jgi:hypothetical protein
MSSTQAESVRKSFRDFVRRHSGAEPPSAMLETTLIRDGSYCGRRFSLMGYALIWFIDEQQIKLFGQNGSLLKSIPAADFCKDIPMLRVSDETRRAA